MYDITYFMYFSFLFVIYVFPLCSYAAAVIGLMAVEPVY
jgi:hypothetical protein